MEKQDFKAICSQMFSDYPDIVTVKDLQKMLGISRTFAYRAIDNGELPAIRIGVSYKIPKLCVIQYLVDHQKEKKRISEENPAPFSNQHLEEKNKRKQEKRP